MSKYEIRTQKKKDAIIGAALALFKQKGYTNVSINDIAGTSGVSSVSIYNYFGSKEGLAQECARVLMAGATEKAEELLKQKGSFKERLLQVIEICAGQHQQLLGEFFTPEALNDKVLVEIYTDNANKIRMDIIRDFIESGKEEGAIDHTLSTEVIMEYLNAIAEIQMSWETTNSGTRKIHELYTLMLYGLIGR